MIKQLLRNFFIHTFEIFQQITSSLLRYTKKSPPHSRQVNHSYENHLDSLSFLFSLFVDLS